MKMEKARESEREGIMYTAVNKLCSSSNKCPKAQTLTSYIYTAYLYIYIAVYTYASIYIYIYQDIYRYREAEPRIDGMYNDIRLCMRY